MRVNSIQKLGTYAAAVAGVGILCLCFLGGYAEATRESISLEDDAFFSSDENRKRLAATAATVRTVVISFFLTGVIDVVVAVALLLFCLARTAGSVAGEDSTEYPSVRELLLYAVAGLAAFFRLGYAFILMACLNGLAQVPAMLVSYEEMLSSPARTRPTAAEPQLLVAKETLIRDTWRSFALGFNGVALGFFGLHLALLAVPFFCGITTKSTTPARTGFYPSIVLPLLLLVAGFGYTGDALGIFVRDKTFGLTSGGCFVGEVLLMLWLLSEGIFGCDTCCGWCWGRGRGSESTGSGGEDGGIETGKIGMGTSRDGEERLLA